MNVLFLSLINFKSFEQSGIYTDLLREFIKNGHHIYAVNSNERRNGETTKLIEENGSYILSVRTFNIQKTNIVEKGIGTLSVSGQFERAINKYFSGVKFDLILYPTPPITLCDTVYFFKKKDRAKTYLLLKDIFPQNAIDIGMMADTGIKGFLYRYFRKKEKKLYSISDYIGCMSKANVEYLILHNPEIEPEKVEICPNSVDPVDMSVDVNTRNEIRRKYDIPLDKKVFVYGGNLGKPQGIDFMLDCLKSQGGNNLDYFLIVGDGTEYEKIETFIENEKPSNVRLMRRLPKEDYDRMVGACDVGMIFLDHRFTIPNFPSRLLSYMQAKIPVLAVTDSNTDIGGVITNGGFGWWCESNDVNSFNRLVNNCADTDLKAMGQSGYDYLINHYTAQRSYEIIMQHLEKLD